MSEFKTSFKSKWAVPDRRAQFLNAPDDRPEPEASVEAPVAAATPLPKVDEEPFGEIKISRQIVEAPKAPRAKARGGEAQVLNMTPVAVLDPDEQCLACWTDPLPTAAEPLVAEAAANRMSPTMRTATVSLSEDARNRMIHAISTDEGRISLADLLSYMLSRTLPLVTRSFAGNHAKG
jgi:hypothetical protein